MTEVEGEIGDPHGVGGPHVHQDDDNDDDIEIIISGWQSHIGGGEPQ